MAIRMTTTVRVEDPRRHPRQLVEELEGLLADGNLGHADPHHKGVFEVEGDRHIYYIYLFPQGDRAQLLATWPKDLTLAVLDRAAD